MFVSLLSPRAAASSVASAGNGEAPFVFASRLRTLGDAGAPPPPGVVKGGAGRCRRGVDLDSEGVVDAVEEGVPGVPGVPGAAFPPRGLGLLVPGGTGNRLGDFFSIFSNFSILLFIFVETVVRCGGGKELSSVVLHCETGVTSGGRSYLLPVAKKKCILYWI